MIFSGRGLLLAGRRFGGRHLVRGVRERRFQLDVLGVGGRGLLARAALGGIRCRGQSPPPSRTRPSSRPSPKRGSTAIGRRTSSRSDRRSCSRHRFSSSRCNCSCTCSRPSSTRPASSSPRNCPSSSPTNYMFRTDLLFCTTPCGDWPSCMPPGTCSPLLSSARLCGPPPRAAGGAGAFCTACWHTIHSCPVHGMSSGLPGQAGSPWQAN